jgi:cardiolipin synthase
LLNAANLAALQKAAPLKAGPSRVNMGEEPLANQVDATPNGAQLTGMTPASYITVGRLLLAPAVLIFVLRGNYYWALTAFALAIITDMVDGAVARRLKCQTQLGAVLDVTADKILLTPLYLALAFFSNPLLTVPGWLAIIVFGRDLILACGAGLLYHRRKELEVAPLLVGKLTAILQMALVFGVLLASVSWASAQAPGWAATGFFVLILVTAVVSLVSLAQYFHLGLSLSFSEKK